VTITASSDYYGIEALAARTAFESGECLIRRRQVRASANETVPVRLQVLEPDYLDSTKVGPVGNGNYCIYGVELDSTGRRVAYWLWPNHPGDVLLPYTAQSFKSERVPAEEIVHLFEKRRPGQVRGAVRLAAALIKLRDLDEYEEAELVRKKIEACFTAFIKGPGRDLPVSDNTSTDTAKSNTPRIETFSPGLIMYGSEDEDITFGSPNSSGGYGDYTKTQLRAIAMAAGTTYEQLTGDLSGVNFSSMRGGRQEFRGAHRAIPLAHVHPDGVPATANWFGCRFPRARLRTLKHRARVDAAAVGVHPAGGGRKNRAPRDRRRPQDAQRGAARPRRGSRGIPRRETAGAQGLRKGRRQIRLRHGQGWQWRSGCRR
jgi:lambda family phage portal protein